MVRKFELINEKGEPFTMMDIKKGCLFIEPQGLGYGYNSEYESIGDFQIRTLRKVKYEKITGNIVFESYEKYGEFIRFVESSESLCLAYTIPFKEGEKTYYKDIEIETVEKTEISLGNVISETISINSLSLWYEKYTVVHYLKKEKNETRFSFKIPSILKNKSNKTIFFYNDGHTEASLKIEIVGPLLNPSINLYRENKKIQSVRIKEKFEEEERLIYNSKVGEFAIEKVNDFGEKTNLFNLEKIYFENDNVIRIPKNKECILEIECEGKLQGATVQIYKYYKAI